MERTNRQAGGGAVRGKGRYIALFGVSVETGVVMPVYLNETFNRYLLAGPVTKEQIHSDAIEESVLRLRPKLMTATTSPIGFCPSF